MARIVYRPSDVAIGRRAAVADFGIVRFKGSFAWLTWLFVHLMYLVEFSNRVLVFIQWGFLYLTYNQGARLITGPANLAADSRIVGRTPGPQPTPRSAGLFM